MKQTEAGRDSSEICKSIVILGMRNKVLHVISLFLLVKCWKLI